MEHERDSLIVQHAIKPHIVYSLEPRLLETTPSTRIWSMALVNGRVWVLCTKLSYIPIALGWRS